MSKNDNNEDRDKITLIDIQFVSKKIPIPVKDKLKTVLISEINKDIKEII